MSSNSNLPLQENKFPVRSQKQLCASPGQVYNHLVKFGEKWVPWGVCGGGGGGYCLVFG